MREELAQVAGARPPRVRPTWLRYSDYRSTPPVIVEYDAEALARLK